MNICCTLVSGSYFIGAATLINSLIEQGFQGEVHVGYVGDIPSWWPKDDQEIAKGVRVVSIPVQMRRFLGYEKPFFMQAVARSRPECTRLFWCDADIVALTPWSFIQNWLDGGVTVCSDIAYPRVWPLHPWRRDWRKLIAKAGIEEGNPNLDLYVNAGFLGCRAEDFSILEIWASLTQAYEDMGGNINAYNMSERWNSIVSDQDLLNATLMCWSGPLAPLGPEGMGFNGMPFPFSHGTENPKPWQLGAVARHLSGRDLSRYRRQFERLTRLGPIKPYDKKTLILRRLDMKTASFLWRIYRLG